MNLPVHCGLLPYDELNVMIRDESFCDDLDASMDALVEIAREVAKPSDPCSSGRPIRRSRRP